MDKKYWNKISKNYAGEIFSVFDNDTKKIIQSEIARLASPEKTVLDFGCGTGYWLPFLAENFKKVIAVDFSDELIKLSKEKYAHLKNIEFHAIDITKNKLNDISTCDLIVCINVFITALNKKRRELIKALLSGMKSNSDLVLVVPSLESALFTEYMMHEWNSRMEVKTATYRKKDVHEKFHNIKQGIVDLQTVPTKHYLQEEIASILKGYGLATVKIVKVEYAWKTEFENPPKWMNSQYPWDWLIIAHKS